MAKSCLSGQKHAEPSCQRNETSTRPQCRIPEKVVTEGKRRLFPNFDLELASLRANSPICDPKALEGDDDGLRTISEILNCDRSRKQETNDPGTDNAITQQAHADFYPPYKSGQKAGIAKVGKNKRPRETPLSENDAPPLKHHRTVDYPPKEKVTWAHFCRRG